MDEQSDDQQDSTTPVKGRGRRWWPVYSGLGLVATLLLVYFGFGGDTSFQYGDRSIFVPVFITLLLAFLIGTAPGFCLVMVDRGQTWWRFLLLVIGVIVWLFFCAIGTWLFAYAMSPID